jgi:hypothetical protein
MHACRRVTGDTQHLPPNWEELVEDMNQRIAFTTLMAGLDANDAPHFVYSMDETIVWFVPMGGCRTLAEKGSRRVYVFGSEEKKGYTISFTIKADGTVLPMQLIYQGTTDLSTAGGMSEAARKRGEKVDPV